jgi:hypothetical protein
MSACQSWYTMLIVLTVALASGLVVTRTQADETSELYPGRYVAHCKPAPNVGCVCETDALGQVSTFPQPISQARNGTDGVQEVEFLRMIDWLQRTCMALTQPSRVPTTK